MRYLPDEKDDSRKNEKRNTLMFRHTTENNYRLMKHEIVLFSHNNARIDESVRKIKHGRIPELHAHISKQRGKKQHWHQGTLSLDLPAGMMLLFSGSGTCYSEPDAPAASKADWKRFQSCHG